MSDDDDLPPGINIPGITQVAHADERHDSRFVSHPLLDGWDGREAAVAPRVEVLPTPAPAMAPARGSCVGC